MASAFEKDIHYQTFQRARRILLEMGLITIETTEGRRLYHELTEIGQKVAEYVNSIEEALNQIP